jgi:predicted HD phosphohydrolase
VGGLAEHSLEVCKIALEENDGSVDRDSIIIASILHDMCKVMYDFPPEKGYYGHGSKSVQIIEDYVGFKLTDEEWRAIRFHMGSKSRRYDEDTIREYEIARTEKLWELIHTSDCLSCGHYPKSMRSTVKSIMTLFNL